LRTPILPFLLVGSLALGGCAASLAASAVGAAIRSSQSQKQPTDQQNWPQAAAAACQAHAAQFGEVRIIDVELRQDKVVVWGTAGEGAQKRSFECPYNGKISGFKLRTITGSR
jgi:hypothetical protein